MQTFFFFNAENEVTVLSQPQFVNLTRSLSFQLWESQWASSSTGRFTFLFFNSVSSILSRPWFKARGPLARFISGHSECESYLKRFNIVSRQFCTCEFSPGDLFHDLFSCRQFSKINCNSHDYDPGVLTSEPLYLYFLRFAKLRESYRRFQLSLTNQASAFFSLFSLFSEDIHLFSVLFSFPFIFFSGGGDETEKLLQSYLLLFCVCPSHELHVPVNPYANISHPIFFKFSKMINFEVFYPQFCPKCFFLTFF